LAQVVTADLPIMQLMELQVSIQFFPQLLLQVADTQLASVELNQFPVDQVEVEEVIQAK
jgi:hypothetical protein